MSFTRETTRDQSEVDTLNDATAMWGAAEGDADVKTLIGLVFLKAMHVDIEHFRALVTGKETIDHAKLADGTHVLELATALLEVMEFIRGLAEGVVTDEAAQKKLGKGATWHASQPEKLALAAQAMATLLHENPEIAKAIHLDKQHAHDLEHLSAAILDLHEHHTKLIADRKSDTHARETLKAALRARAHFVRVRARLAHRHDPKKLAAFESPVAHHKVEHRKKPAPPAA